MRGFQKGSEQVRPSHKGEMHIIFAGAVEGNGWKGSRMEVGRSDCCSHLGEAGEGPRQTLMPVRSLTYPFNKFTEPLRCARHCPSCSDSAGMSQRDRAHPNQACHPQGSS